MQETQVQFLVRNIPWKKASQATPVFLPEKSHGQRSLVGYSPWSHREPDRHNWATQHTHTHTHTHSDLIVVFVQLLSHVQLCDSMDSSTPGFPALHHLPELAQTHVHWVGGAIQPSHPRLPLSSALNLRSIRVFSSESTLCMRWPKYRSFSFSISPSNEYSGLISFRIDCFDLLAIQGTLKSHLQHHSSKASILRCSAFFVVQLSHPYMTTGKTIALTRWTFVGKVMSLLFYMLSMLVIAFLPSSKHLLISWLQSPSAVILEPKKKKSQPLFPLFPHLFPMKWWYWMPWS